jgi:nucleotide-binding universal stress UspA family protein
MYKRILIATDGSELASKALEHGMTLAKTVNAPVVVVTVTEPWSSFDLAREVRQGSQNPIVEFEEIAASASNRILEKASQAAQSRGVTCELLHMKDQHPAEGIVKAATDKGCDLIVMASHGRRGISRALLGSQANEVVTHSKVPTLIVR